MMKLWLLLVGVACVWAQGVRVEFDPERPNVGPFPSDYLTFPDFTSWTGLRVNLPAEECAPGRPCDEFAQLNQLDGFHTNPRLTVKFNGPVNPETLRDGIYLVWLEPAYARPYELGRTGDVMPVNQVQWDPGTNTAYAKPDTLLEQGRQYALVVTDAVKDQNGRAVGADLGFELCLRREVGGEYCAAVSRAAALAPRGRVVGGSVFTTMNATGWLEDVYRLTRGLNAGFQRTGARSVVSLSEIRSIVWRQDRFTRAGSELLDVPFPAPPALLQQYGVGRVAFGSIQSPRFLDERHIIRREPGGVPTAVPTAAETIPFHVWLPATPPPGGGYPVVLAGHGIGDMRFGGPSVMAAGLTPRGFAVVAMNAYGHGLGPRGALRVETSSGVIDIPAPGRGADTDGDGVISELEGCVVLAGPAPVAIRDCLRQTAADYFAMVRAIQQGMDLDGDGRADLNPSAISFFGQSLGSFYGAMATAVDPAIGQAVLNAGGGSTMEAVRWSPSFGLLFTLYLAATRPQLLNAGLGFNEEFPTRHQGVRILGARNAAALGAVIDRLDWLQNEGNPMNFGPLFDSATPSGSPIKRVLFQIALGDQTVPNPSNSLLSAAANLQRRTWLYRHDIARAAVPELPANPHIYLAWLAEGNPVQQAVSLAVLAQAQAFLAGVPDGLLDPNPLVQGVFRGPVFEVPAQLPFLPGFLRP